MKELIFVVLVLLIIAFISKLVYGVQKAKRNGEYLLPDFVEEEETVCPEEEDGA